MARSQVLSAAPHESLLCHLPATAIGAAAGMAITGRYAAKADGAQHR